MDNPGEGARIDNRVYNCGTYFIIPLKAVNLTKYGFRFPERVQHLLRIGMQIYDWRFNDLYSRANDLF